MGKLRLSGVKILARGPTAAVGGRLKPGPCPPHALILRQVRGTALYMLYCLEFLEPEASKNMKSSQVSRSPRLRTGWGGNFSELRI